MSKLNPKQVENLTEPSTYEDGDGLRLVVKPTGRKSWLLRFHLARRRREMGLGSFPKVSLKKARQDASTKRTQLSDGIDPLAARDIERAAQRSCRNRLTAISGLVSFPRMPDIILEPVSVSTASISTPIELEET